MKVFISYSPHDEDLARKVAEGLRKSGLEVWDDRNIFPGDNWAKKTSQALEQSKAMVVLITPEALRSKWVRWEIEYALGKKDFSTTLIPVIVGPAEAIPRDEFPWILRRLNIVNLSRPQEEESAIRQIADALRASSGKPSVRRSPQKSRTRPGKGRKALAVAGRR
jgi:hypothetical protein